MITQAAIFFFPGCFRWIHKQKIEPKISKFFFKNLTKTSCLNLEILSILIWFSSKNGGYKVFKPTTTKNLKLMQFSV